jgi:hypothetical protein
MKRDPLIRKTIYAGFKRVAWDDISSHLFLTRNFPNLPGLSQYCENGIDLLRSRISGISRNRENAIGNYAMG